MIAFGRRLPLSLEYVRREQERPAVDGRLVDLFAQGHRHLALNTNPAAFVPGVGGRIWIDEHCRLPGPDEVVERALTEHVVRRDNKEQVLAPHGVLCRSKGRAVAELPRARVHGMNPAWLQPGHHCTNGTGMVAHDHQDLLDPGVKEAAHGSLDQLQPTQLDQRLRATSGDRLQTFRASSRQHHSHVGHHPWPVLPRQLARMTRALGRGSPAVGRFRHDPSLFRQPATHGLPVVSNNLSLSDD